MFDPEDVGRIGPPVRWRNVTGFLAAWVRTPTGWWGEVWYIGVHLGDDTGVGTAVGFTAHASQLRPFPGIDYSRVPRRRSRESADDHPEVC